MKKLFTVIVALTFQLNLFSQTVIKQSHEFNGKLNKLELDRISPDAYEKGVVFIKLTTQANSIYEQNRLSNRGTTGIREFDALTDRYQVLKIDPLFSNSNLDKKIDARHKQWGFDCWYILHFDPNDDVKELIKQYSALKEVETVEPVFKIVRYTDVDGKAANVEVQRNLTHLATTIPLSQENIAKSAADAQRDYIPNDSLFSLQTWHYNKIELPKAWELTTGSASVIVSINDGGVQYNHPDLEANMWPAIGPDGINTSADSHGTHVAGTVAAVTNNTIGVAGIAGGNGVDHGIQLMSVDIFKGSLSTYEGYVYAADHGASISQNSWGYENPDVYNQPDLLGINYFVANGGGEALNGGLVVFAAGNDGTNKDWYPGRYDSTFSVAATTQTDAKASFSNYGSWVDIAAPGVSIFSTDFNSSYSTKQGTSMACPHVSGVAALIVSKYPGVFSADQLKKIIQNYSDNIDTADPAVVGLIGAGRLNAYKPLHALDSIMQNRPSLISIQASSNQIELSWNLNADQDSVLVLYSDSPRFPIPSGTYLQGESTDNNSKVAYIGKGNSLILGDLKYATTYHFMLYSRLADGSYSYGLPCSATTDCGSYSVPYSLELPLLEIPRCWTSISNTQNKDQTWQVGNFIGGLSTLNENYLFLNSKYFTSTDTQNADLISPSFDTRGVANVKVSYSQYYRQATNSIATFSYSLDDGASWVEQASWQTTTSNPSLVDLSIAEIQNQPSVRFKWNLVSTYGAIWAFDKFKLSVSTAIPNIGAAAAEVKVYPNPVKDIINVEVGANDGGSLTVTLFSMAGKKLYETINENSTRIDVSNFLSGIYFMRIKINKLTVTKQIVIQK